MNQTSNTLTNNHFIWQVETVHDYDEYCHYVSGLVGIGLSKIFHDSGKEDLASDRLSDSVGLFLQVGTYRLISHIPQLRTSYANDKYFCSESKCHSG